MANVAAVGLDFGGQTAVLAIAKKGGIEVVTNEASQRETPLVVGFGQNERFLGEQAFVQLKSNFKNSVSYPIRFLGVKPGSSALQNEKKWIYSGVVETEDKIGFEVKYRGEKRIFSPEQIVAMSLQKMKQIAHSHGVTHNDMVITVPSYFTIDERKGLLDSAKIAQVNVLKILNESTSIALSYGIFRRNEFSNKPINVCFVDVGHCKTSVFAAAFTKEELKLLNQLHDRNLGTRDLDWATMEYYAEIVKKNTGSDILTREKSRLRILDALEKQRKILSANSEATLNVDFIVEDYDLNHTLKREEYENINAKFFDKFREQLTQLKNEIKDLHSVEIIGGGTRIPHIQKIIQEVFKKPCSKTLHATECVARGAAVRSLMFHPLYKAGQFSIEENIYHPIRCKVNYPSLPDQIKEEGKSAEDDLTCILFNKGCKMPAAKAIDLKKSDAHIDIDLTYDPEIPGYPNKLGHIKVQTQKSEANSFSNKTRLVINENGLLEIDKVELVEEFKIEPLKPQKEQKIGLGTKILNTLKFWNREQEESVKASVELKSTDLKYETNIRFGLTENDIAKYAKEEVEMLNFDKSVNETNESRNSLESYIYEIKGKLDDEYKALVSAEQKAKLLETLDSTNDWLYKNTSATKKDYQSKRDEIRGMVSQYEKRVNDWKELRSIIDEYKSNVNEKDIVEIIPPEKLEEVKKLIEEANKWIESYEKIKEDESNLSHYTQEIRVKANDFLNKIVELSKIEEIPEVQPKVEEPKPATEENKTSNVAEKPTTIEEEKPEK